MHEASRTVQETGPKVPHPKLVSGEDVPDLATAIGYGLLLAGPVIWVVREIWRFLT